MSDFESPPPPLPTFGPAERVCGNCKLWSAHSVDARGWVGPCRIAPQRGLFPPTAPICDAFVGRPQVTARASEPVGKPRSQRGPTLSALAPAIVRRVRDPNEVVDLGGDLNMTRDELMQVFLEATGQAEVPLAQKWEGGSVKLVPRSADLQGKDLPIDALFHKVVMVRDRLRTLEQKINGHPKLSDLEKIEMQQYITRCYGSLTTFNVLFREKGDQFVGQKGDE